MFTIHPNECLPVEPVRILGPGWKVLKPPWLLPPRPDERLVTRLLSGHHGQQETGQHLGANMIRDRKESGLKYQTLAVVYTPLLFCWLLIS